MSSTVEIKSFNTTPTNVYFLAKVAKLFDEPQLNLCRKAAQEYVRSQEYHSLPSESLTPCDTYFTTITTARGCIAFDDELNEVQSSPVSHGFMDPHRMAPYYEAEAESYVKNFLQAGAVQVDKNLRSEIVAIITPYLKKREAKVNQFSDDVIKYVYDGTLTGKKNERDFILTFKRLDADEQQQITNRVNKIILQKVPNSANPEEEKSHIQSWSTYFRDYSITDSNALLVQERAAKFATASKRQLNEQPNRRQMG